MRADCISTPMSVLSPMMVTPGDQPESLSSALEFMVTGGFP